MPGGGPPQACLANATAEEWRAAYQTFYNQAMHDAVNARNEAAGELQKIFDGVTGGKLQPGDRASWNDVLAGFLGAKTRYRAFVEGQVDKLKGLKNDARLKAIEDARQADGKFGKWSPEDQAAFNDAKAKFGAGADQLAGAENSEGMFSKVMGYSASDIPSVSRALEDSSSLLKAGPRSRSSTWPPPGPPPASTPRRTWPTGCRPVSPTPLRRAAARCLSAPATWRATRPPGWLPGRWPTGVRWAGSGWPPVVSASWLAAPESWPGVWS